MELRNFEMEASNILVTKHYGISDTEELPMIRK